MAKVKAKPNQSSAIDIVVDLGNSLLKGMFQGRRNSAIVVPHAVRKVSPQVFDSILSRHKLGYQRGIKDVDVNMFVYDGQAVVVGENAEDSHDDIRVGAPKYRKDYYPYLLMAILLRLVPHGHDNIRIMGMFPPGDSRFIDTLIESLGGKHVVTRVDGSEVIYKVRAVNVIDEPVAGIRCFQIAENGRYFRNRNVGSGLGLGIDIGGKLSSIVPYRADGYVDYDHAVTFDIGIQDVMRNVSDLLLATPEYQPYFDTYRGSVLPFDEGMRAAIRTGIYVWGGYEIDVLWAIADATESIRNRVKDEIDRQYGGVGRFRYSSVSGGGGGALYEQIVEHVLAMPSNVIYRAIDNPELMHFANMFGADAMLAAMLSEGRV